MAPCFSESVSKWNYHHRNKFVLITGKKSSRWCQKHQSKLRPISYEWERKTKTKKKHTFIKEISFNDAENFCSGLCFEAYWKVRYNFHLLCFFTRRSFPRNIQCTKWNTHTDTKRPAERITRLNCLDYQFAPKTIKHFHLQILCKEG